MDTSLWLVLTGVFYVGSLYGLYKLQPRIEARFGKKKTASKKRPYVKKPVLPKGLNPQLAEKVYKAVGQAQQAKGEESKKADFNFPESDRPFVNPMYPSNGKGDRSDS